jgi:DNA-binding Lrp family transcriptional regulator
MATLNERERKLLACIQHQAHCSISDLAARLGYQEHALRYSLAALRQRGVLLRVVPFLDVYRLGLSYFCIYFSLHTDAVKRRGAILKELQERKEVSFIGRYGGDYQYVISICSDSVHDVSQLVWAISAKYGSIFYLKALIVQERYTVFSRKYLAPEIRALPSLQYGDRKNRAEVDELDRKILQLVTKQHLAPQRELAQKLGVPFTTLGKRLQRLQANGVIAGYLHIINERLLGVQEYKLLVSVRAISQPLREELTQYAAAHPSVIRFIECFGEWDFELDIEVFESQQLGTIVESLYERFGGYLNSVRILQAFEHIKFNPFPG